MTTYRIPILAPRLVRDGYVVAESRKADGPRLAADIVRTMIPDDGREHFGILMLDVRNKIIGAVEISMGALTATIVAPRDVYRPAIAGGAVALVLFHTHPSQDPEPSAEDISITRRLAAVGTLVGIEVLDHVIVGGDRYVSLKDRGILS